VAEQLTIGDWRIDPEALELRSGARRVRLEPRVMAVLLHLRSRSPHPVSVAELLGEVWGDSAVGDNVVHRAVALVRKALGESGRHGRFIETVPTLGYRFVGGVPEATPAPAVSAPLTLAVLAFACLSTDPEDGLLEQGLTQEIWNQLGRLPDVRVVSLTSSRRYAGRPDDIRAIGVELGVRFLVEGAVQRLRDRLRIHAVLTDADSGLRITGKRYERQLSGMQELFALYDDVAMDVREVLGRHLRRRLPEPGETAVPTQSIAAYQLFQEGWRVYRQSGSAGKALQRFDGALSIDRDYVDARVARASMLIQRSEMNRNRGPAIADHQNARDEILDVLDGHPDHWFATLTLARLHAVLELDFPRADAAWRRAAAKGAPELQVLHFRSLLYVAAGRFEEAVDVCRTLEVLDPRDPYTLDWIGRALYLCGDTAAAWNKMDRAVDLEPDNRHVFRTAYTFCLYAGDRERVEQVVRHADAHPDLEEPFMRPIVALLQGDPEVFRRALRGWEANRASEHVAAGVLTQATFYLEEYERHIHWWAVREQEFDGLMWTQYEIALLRGYWSALERWAAGRDRKRRRALLADHRTRIGRITRNMSL
jgi:TolB-like protein